MKKEPLISVIIPMYKVEDYLKRCLDSVINQTYKNLEIILVDDGSPDSCPQICDEYAKNDKRIKVIHKENGGLMAAWIDGLKESTGEYIYFVDSDDWLELESVQKYVDVIKENQPDMIINNYYMASNNSKVLKRGVEYNRYGFLENNEFEKFKNAYLRYNCSFTFHRWNKVTKRDILVNNIKYCDTRISIYEDVNINFAVMLDIKNVYLLNEPSYNYFVRENSMIRETFKEKNIVNHERVLDAMIKITEEKNANTEQLTCCFTYFMILRLVDGILASKNKKQYFQLLVESKLLNNVYSDKISVYLDSFKRLIYKNLRKNKIFNVKILRKFASLKRKLFGK